MNKSLWEAIYMVMVLMGATTALVFGVLTLNKSDGWPYAMGYVLIVVFGSSTMLLLGIPVFRNWSISTKNSGAEKDKSIDNKHYSIKNE